MVETISYSNPSYLIEVRNLKKVFFVKKAGLFGKGVPILAVSDVSFVIDRKETLGLVGESGCGKSTLAKLILALVPKTSGKVFFLGEDITEEKDIKKYRKRLQIIFQDPYSSLNPKMKIKDILEEPFIIHGEKNFSVEDLLYTVGLKKRYKDLYPFELSGGERQRVALARAIALKPDFVICDEPTSSLDLPVQAQIIDLLLSLQDEFHLSYLFISHDIGLTAYISDRIAVMYKGKIVEEGKSTEIYKNPLHPYTKLLISHIPSLVGDLEWETYLEDEEGEGACPFYGRCKLKMDMCKRIPPEMKRIGERFVACHIY